MLLRVCTYNIHGGTDSERQPALPAIIATIAEINPDIALLQEVDRFLPRSSFQHQARRIAQALGMRFDFYGRLRCGPSAFGNAILTRDRQARPAAMRLPLPATGGEPRCAIGLPVPELEASVWCLHLGLKDEWRTTQLQALAERIHGSAGRVLVGGDFNAGFDAPETAEFLQAARLTALSGDEPTFPVPNPAHRIDFLFGRGFRRRAGGSIAAPGSDHCLVWSDLETE